jgi:uncharacterized membrane protein
MKKDKKGVNWIHLAHDKVWWMALVSIVLNLSVLITYTVVKQRS